ncbi:MAG TPA: ABC-2 family transporter protein [Acidimicrobiia bacterium]|jgi:ABC-2 type transport system permease protein|nr:ABC-2 family transporter protein [Acidimicrobiia bacterium]
MNGLLATMRNALAEAAAKRAALLSAMTIMIVNDAVWVAFWVLFFHRVGHLHGWDSRRVLLLLSVMTSAAGITLGLFSNARRVGQMAVEGALDAVLALPVQPLPFLLVRRVEPVNIGDFAFGITLFCIVGHPTPVHIVVFAGVVLAASVLITGFLVLTGSIAFFAGRGEGGELGFHAILLLGSYPVDVFAGAAKVMLYTVVPAAFVSSIPARLVLSFDPARAAWLVGISALFATAGTVAFTRGLRRYTSGAVWTRG